MNEKFLEVGDVMQILGISRSAAYKLMRQINSELEKKVRCEQWTSIIKECLASGMPKTTWCREHGISDKSFFYWQRILREEAYLTTLESTLTPAVKRIQLQQLQILLKSK